MKSTIFKKFVAGAAALALSLSMAACAGTKAPTKGEEATVGSSKTTVAETPASAPIKVAALKGPTALGLVNLIEKNEKASSKNTYDFTMAGAPDEIVGKLVSGELDIAAVPTNLAATLYQKTKGEVQMAALNTMGVLYVLEKGDSIKSVKDLKGKTIYATGQGATPEYALNLVLKNSGLTPGENVNVIYKQEHVEIAPLLASGEATIALLPQPFVTSVMMKDNAIRVALDLTKEWDSATNSESGLTMGCVVVRKDFVEKNKEAFDSFLDEYKASVELATESQASLEHTSELSEKYDIMPQAVALKAIPECSIVFVEGSEMKKIASGFLKVLYDANPKSVGGALPDDGLYYSR